MHVPSRALSDRGRADHHTVVLVPGLPIHSGRNAAVGVCFPSAGMSVQGETRDFVSIADSGNKMHRRFCPSCGTHLFSEADSRPHLMFVRAGTLDDTEVPRPEATIWTASAPSWACIDDTRPKFERQAPPPILSGQ
jgi:hypothetical protein